jgi:excisionase family DNA binding protein
MTEIRSDNSLDAFATPAQVAARLAISDETVYRLIRAGEIKAINCAPRGTSKLKALWRIRWDWVDEYVTHRLAEAPSPLVGVARVSRRKAQTPRAPGW